MLLLALGAALGRGSSSQAGALDIGSDKQLFVGPWTEDGRDAHLVESMSNVTMTMNPARATGEKLMVVDKPWEGAGSAHPFCDMRQFVLKDGDTFRMYYSAMPNYGKLWDEPNCRILCYAESTDGIHWVKPNLGLCTWKGSKNNNIIIPYDGADFLFSEIEGAAVFIDPNARSKDEKFKMFAKMTPAPKRFYKSKDIPRLQKAQYRFASPDGIHWKMMSRKKVSPKANDTQFSVLWDDQLGKYVAYTRVFRHPKAQAEYYRKLYGGKKARTAQLHVGRMASADFVTWSKEVTVLGPDAVDMDPPGVGRMDFYGGNVSKYSEAPSIYLAIPNAYYHWRFDLTVPGKKWKNGQLPSTIDVQLATSRDGIHWNRTPQRKPFIRLGPQGSFWSKQTYPSAEFIRVGDELWVYFAGLDQPHNQDQGRKPTQGARSRAVLRLDGFISADAAYTGGELTTKPLVFAGSKLQLNVDTSAGGITKVEIQDESGKPIKGFAEANADEINGNYIRVLASWKGKTDVSALAGKPVRLRFVMRDTKLYSFQFLP